MENDHEQSQKKYTVKKEMPGFDVGETVFVTEKQKSHAKVNYQTFICITDEYGYSMETNALELNWLLDGGWIEEDIDYIAELVNMGFECTTGSSGRVSCVIKQKHIHIYAESYKDIYETLTDNKLT